MADGKQGMMVLDLSQNPITQIQRKLNELDVGLKVWLSKQSVAVEAAAVTAAAAAQGAAMGGIMGTLTKDSSSSSFLSPPPSSLDPQAMPSLKQAQDPIPLTQVPMGPGALQDPPLVNLESSSSVELPLQPVISTMVVHQPAPSILNQDPHFEAMGGCNLPETTAPLVDSKDTSRPSSSTTPVVASLEKTGDILFLHMSEDPIRAGEIVVFNVEGRPIPIVHRVIEVHERHDTGEVDVLTKGDNNDFDDRLLYAPGQLWLHRHHIMGRAVGFLPYIGYVTIIMTDYPILKYILIGALGLLVITSKD